MLLNASHKLRRFVRLGTQLDLEATSTTEEPEDPSTASPLDFGEKKSLVPSFGPPTADPDAESRLPQYVLGFSLSLSLVW